MLLPAGPDESETALILNCTWPVPDHDAARIPQCLCRSHTGRLLAPKHWESKVGQCRPDSLNDLLARFQTFELQGPAAKTEEYMNRVRLQKSPDATWINIPTVRHRSDSHATSHPVCPISGPPQSRPSISNLQSRLSPDMGYGTFLLPCSRFLEHPGSSGEGWP